MHVRVSVFGVGRAMTCVACKSNCLLVRRCACKGNCLSYGEACDSRIDRKGSFAEIRGSFAEIRGSFAETQGSLVGVGAPVLCLGSAVPRVLLRASHTHTHTLSHMT